MFEEYLEDAYYFATEAKEKMIEREAKRYYRASVFYAASALEAFVSYISGILIEGGLQPYETALLTDKKFHLNKGKFEVSGIFELHGIEDKVKFLFYKHKPAFDFEHYSPWSQFIEFKDFRNAIIHPTHEDDEINIVDYQKKIKMGLSAIIEIIDCLCIEIIGKPLRQKIKDLTL
jgi:hypothetical protein